MKIVSGEIDKFFLVKNKGSHCSAPIFCTGGPSPILSLNGKFNKGCGGTNVTNDRPYMEIWKWIYMGCWRSRNAHSSSKGCVPTYILSNITYAVLLVVLAMEVEKKSSGNLGLGNLQEGMVLGIHLLAQGILDFFGESLFNGNIYCCDNCVLGNFLNGFYSLDPASTSAAVTKGLFASSLLL